MHHPGVVGTGLMGTGIAQVAAQAGFAVRINDLREEALQAAITRIRRGLERVHPGFLVNRILGPLLIEAICDVFYAEFGDPKYRAPILLRRYVTAGWLGCKSGKGFYDYPAQQ